MGKATRWFRSLFGLSKKSNDTSSPQPGPNSSTHKQPPKKKWSFAKSQNRERYDLMETSQHNGGVKITSTQNDDVDPNKHAIAVAAATAAVAEAAVAAANAAAAVVKLTSSGRATTNATNGGGGGGGADSSVHVSGTGAGYGNREEWAAVKIQSHFRAYLSRRALRALKALVRLQALVRGYIARKRTAEEMQRTQALLRIQARVRAGRSQIFDSPISVYKYIHPSPSTPEKFEHVMQARSLKYDGSMTFKRNGSKSNGRVVNDLARARGWEQEGSSVRSGPIDDRRNDKILEIDTGKPHIMPKRRNLFHSSHLSLGSEQYSQESTAHQSAQSPTSSQLDDACYCTADSSPQFYSASSNAARSNRGPFTPTKSDCSKSCLSGYSDHPNYMSFTKSSKAKMRSLSAPKQRPNYERSNSTKRHSIHNCNDPRANTQRVSTLHANFANKAYPGSGRLDRLGMPVLGDSIGFSGGHWHRF